MRAISLLVALSLLLTLTTASESHYEETGADAWEEASDGAAVGPLGRMATLPEHTP